MPIGLNRIKCINIYISNKQSQFKILPNKLICINLEKNLHNHVIIKIGTKTFKVPSNKFPSKDKLNYDSAIILNPLILFLFSLLLKKSSNN